MPFSAQDALKKARASIEDVRNARGSKFTIIRRYRTAKRALDKVDNVDTDTASLREIIVAFKDLAEVLHQSGEKERAEKCIQRSDALRYVWQSVFTARMCVESLKLNSVQTISC